MLAIIQHPPHYKASLKKNSHLNEMTPMSFPFCLQADLLFLLYYSYYFHHFQNLGSHPFFFTKEFINLDLIIIFILIDSNLKKKIFLIYFFYFWFSLYLILINSFEIIKKLFFIVKY
jgi:hypothetical protein